LAEQGRLSKIGGRKLAKVQGQSNLTLSINFGKSFATDGGLNLILDISTGNRARSRNSSKRSILANTFLRVFFNKLIRTDNFDK
jgi:hypothetical protein